MHLSNKSYGKSERYRCS